MSDMVPEVLNAALDSLFTPKEPGELEYQGDDGLLYCRNCHTPVQCRVKLWGRDKIVPCLCSCLLYTSGILHHAFKRLQAFERMMQDTGKYPRREDSEDRPRKCPKKKAEPAKKYGEHHAGIQG